MDPDNVPDDPYRTAAPGELPEDREDLEDEDADSLNDIQICGANGRASAEAVAPEGGDSKMGTAPTSGSEATSSQSMTLITVYPIQTPTYLGNASQLEQAEWLELNAIHLRSRWRYLLDSCIALGMELPAESDYRDYCITQYDTECTRQQYLELGL